MTISDKIGALAFDVFGTICTGNRPRGPYFELQQSFSLPAAPFRRLAMTSDLSMAGLVETVRPGPLSEAERETIAKLENDLALECRNIVLFPETVRILNRLKDEGIPF